MTKEEKKGQSYSTESTVVGRRPWKKERERFWIPRTVLHFLGIVHDRATAPWEQRTQASETPRDLNKQTNAVL